MIKPFKIIGTSPAEEGATRVHFEVSRSELLSDGTYHTTTMETVHYVPEGNDVDEYLFKILQEQGWIL